MLCNAIFHQGLHFVSRQKGASEKELQDLFGICSKTCLELPLKKNRKIGFQYRLSLNAGQKYCRMLQRKHSAILSTFIKLPFSIKTLVLSIF